MNPVIATLRAGMDLLARSGHGAALVGGLAVSARAEPRFTRDVDLAVAVVNDAQAEALVGEFRGHGYQVVALVEQEATKRLATVRLGPPGVMSEGVVLDLLFASSGIEPEVTKEAEPIELVEGLTVPVARLGHLVALKLLSRDDRQRPQDLADLRMLLTRATPTDLTLAREALATITQRGFHRGRELLADLEALLS